MTEKEVVVGRTYCGKKPRKIQRGLFDVYFDDRQVRYVSRDRTLVQYDSPSVSLGRKYPMITMERFLAWADRDVTDLSPRDEWRKVCRRSKKGEP